MRPEALKSMPGRAPAAPRSSQRPPSSAMSRSASWMRALALVVRALAPRRSHSTSRRTRLASDSWYAAWLRSTSSRFSRKSL